MQPPLPLGVRLAERLRRFVEFVGRWGAWLILPVVFFTCIDVVGRKIAWHSDEGVLQFSLAGFPLLALFWLGAGPSGILELLTPETKVPIRELVLPVIVIAFAIAANAVLRCAARESRLAA